MTILYKIIAIFMTLTAFFSSLFSGSNMNPKADIETAVCTGLSRGDKGTSDIIKNDKHTPVNCIVISEIGMNIKGFILEALVDGEYITVTGGDTAGEYRFCDFDEISASEFRFTVTDCADGGYTLRSIKLGKREQADRDFRVVSYFVAGGLGDDYVPDAGRFTASTDIIIFGLATFDENGDIRLENEENLPAIIGKCRAANSSLRVHLNILGPSASAEDWDEEMQLKFEKHAAAMRDNKDYFISNIVAILDKYGFDGVYFDWEFPVSDESKLMFSDFLVSLDAALGERELGAAMGAWCSLLSADARRALDSVEVMAYDLFDTYGYHAAFASSYSEIKTFLMNGYRKEQLHLGLAFYARPTDGSANWPSYSDNADKLGQFQNLTDVSINGTDTPAYFNCPQLIRDKTAYALSAELGGVMIWHLSCDTPYSSEKSLYRAIDSVLK